MLLSPLMKKQHLKIQPRFRVICGRDIALGPGKAELLEHVERAGSIAEAAKRMGMSYMRAWKLIKTMERCFKEPLVEVARGGAGHGGAKLTPNGKRALELYRDLERASLSASAAIRKKLVNLLTE